MELAEFIDEAAGLQEQGPEKFTIDNAQKANWALRKLKQLENKKAANKQLAQEEIEKVNAWLEEVNGELQRSIDFFTSLLTEYHRQVLEEDQKAKTIKLPYGKLKMRAQQPEFRRDDDQLLEWLKQTGQQEYIVVKESPAWSDLKKVLKVVGGSVVDPETGEVVPGVEVEERPPKFSVEV